MVVARKIAYNVVFSAITKVLSTTLALVGIGFITRYLGKDGFGNYATVLAFFALFGALGDLGLYSIGTREISRKDAPESSIISKVFTLRILASLIILLLSPLVILFPYPYEVKLGILIAAASFVFSSSYMVLNGVFQKHLAMDRVAIAELFGKILQTAFIILAVKKDWGFTAINLALLVFMTFNFFTILILSRRYIHLKFSFDWPYWKNFLRQSAPLGISVIVTFIYFKLDTIILSLLKSGAEVGIYSAAYKIIENITFFPGMIIGLIFPLFSRHIFSDKIRFEEIANKTFKIFLVLVLPLIIGTLFLADDIVQLIGGAGFSESAGVLRILIFALGFIFFGHFFNNILVAGNAQGKLMRTLVICAIFNVAANLVIIPLYSYTGAAITSALTELLVAILTGSLVIKQFRYSPNVEYWKALLFSGGAMTGFLLLFTRTTALSSIFSTLKISGQLEFVGQFLFLALGSAAVYFTFLGITKVIKREEILSIISRENKSLASAAEPSI